jgi:D-Tyr-tRNAtyr deacylase
MSACDVGTKINQLYEILNEAEKNVMFRVVFKDSDGKWKSDITKDINLNDRVLAISKYVVKCKYLINTGEKYEFTSEDLGSPLNEVFEKVESTENAVITVTKKIKKHTTFWGNVEQNTILVYFVLKN